jgi:coenzyme F420-0:L-glutamate ligase/coenzyme F420-1:gamma-L-glutamate ligase
VFEPDDLAFLDEQRIARLATADAAGEPYVVPVCFVRRETRFYIPIDAKPKGGPARELKRLRNIRERPRAVLLLDRYDEDWNQLRWLLVRAAASILEDGCERESALAALEDRYEQYTRMRLFTLGLPVIALEPTAVNRWQANP